jgi:4-diphosphocytidyl-2-C-methyl-D-erythritol kinase
VLRKRSDGFHEIETLMTAVTLCDTLEFTPRESGEISLACQWGCGFAARTLAMGGSHLDSTSEEPLGDLPTGQDNIVWRAVQRLRARSGVSLGAHIRLTKRIPAAAGLGGASSDAAAALIAANIGWNLALTRQELFAIAAELGSDISFFLGRGAAICRGRGERIEGVRLPRLHVVIVRPPVALSTPQVYQECHPAPGASSEPLVQTLAGGHVAAASRMLNNRLEAAAARLTPWIARLRGEFQRQHVLGYQMSGSGSSYFGICRHARQARRVAARLRSRRAGTVFAAATAVAIAN